jgi:hypothetical protein
MKVYADGRARRLRQQVGDVALVGWVALWIWLADVVHDATLGLAAPGRQIESAGGGLADQIAAAGTSQVHAVEHLAFWLGIAVAAVPVLVLAVVYLPSRWRFAREASAAQRFVDGSADLDLFALRAMASQPLHRLAAVSDDPVRAWRTGDQTVVRALALLALRDAGLTAPERVAPRRAG